MCVAIYKPAGVSLDDNDLFLAHTDNPDGCGMAYRDGERIRIIKGVWPWTHFLAEYQKVQERELLVHFRFATQGIIDQVNCHPFRLRNGGAMAHNGHFSGYGDKVISDTADWLMRYFEDTASKQWRGETLWRMVATIHNQQKMVFLLPNNAYRLVGSWMEYSGAWWSNRDFALTQWEADTASAYPDLAQRVEDVLSMMRPGDLGYDELLDCLSVLENLEYQEEKYHGMDAL